MKLFQAQEQQINGDEQTQEILKDFPNYKSHLRLIPVNLQLLEEFMRKGDAYLLM